MTQGNLLGWTPPHPSPRADTQTVEFARVEGRLAEFIIAWAALREGQEFHLPDIEADVVANLGGSGSSASRILRLLRQSGQLGYRVVNRAKSLYRVEFVR